MTKKSIYIDFVFLALIGVLLSVASYEFFFSIAILPISTYVGFVVWAVVLFYKIKFPSKYSFLVIWMLILATFNLITFSAGLATFGSAFPIRYNGTIVMMPGIDPVFLLVFLLYIVINRSMSKAFYKKLFKPSDEEADANYIRQFNFYYNKFLPCSEDEFAQVIKMLKDYPSEAQDAITKIRAERNV